MDEQEKIYWHGAHYEALQLEFHEYLDVLSFKKEHELSKEALRMDTLIIKKKKDVNIAKNIGAIFKNHNIVEMMFLSLIRNPAGMSPVIGKKSPQIKAFSGYVISTTEAFINFDLSQHKLVIAG